MKTIIYDDVYGIWTDYDQNLASVEVFRLFDMEEELIDNTKLRDSVNRGGLMMQRMDLQKQAAMLIRTTLY